MKKGLLLLLAIAFVQLGFAQDCTSFFPQEEGTQLLLKSYNKKDKLESIVRQTLVSKKNEGGAMIYEVHQETADDKDELLMENDYVFRCEDGRFIIDMKTVMPDEQLEAYEGMEMDVETESIDIPADAKPGEELKDGYISIKVHTGSPVTINMKVSIKDRNVEATEEVTTPAGTFECLKISQKVISDVGFVTVSTNNVIWYAENIGTVRSETYKDNGKLIGYQVLEDIQK